MKLPSPKRRAPVFTLVHVRDTDVRKKRLEHHVAAAKDHYAENRETRVVSNAYWAQLLQSFSLRLLRLDAREPIIGTQETLGGVVVRGREVRH